MKAADGKPDDAGTLGLMSFIEIAEFAPVMLWLIDSTFSSDWANKRWFQFTGGSPEEEAGFGWAHKIHPLDRERVLESFDCAFEARTPLTTEFRLRRFDGEYRWVVDRAEPLYRNNVFAGFVGSCIDVTECRLAGHRNTELLAEMVGGLLQPEPRIII